MGPELHRIINTIMVILSLGASIAVLFFLYVFWKTVVQPYQDINRLKHIPSIKENSVYNSIIQKIICKLKIDLSSAKIVIGRFHNGGSFVNGLPMRKFSLAFETAGGTTIPMMDKNVGVMNSRYPTAFAQLATIDEYFISDVEDCTDLNFKQDMKSWGFNACYLFLIRQFDGKENGFIGINFKYTTVLTAEQRQLVQEQMPRIMGLLNMEKHHLKDEKGN